MTTPSECFKKQVKSNTCIAFNLFIEGIIVFLPIIVFFGYWLTLPAANEFDESMNRVGLLVFGGAASVIINIIYVCIIAIPFLNCYFGEDL